MVAGCRDCATTFPDQDGTNLHLDELTGFGVSYHPGENADNSSEITCVFQPSGATGSKNSGVLVPRSPAPGGSVCLATQTRYRYVAQSSNMAT